MDKSLNQNSKPEDSLIHPLESKTNQDDFFNLFKNALFVGVIVALGVATGYFAHNLKKSNTALKTPSGNPAIIKTEKTAGSTDIRTFRDQAEGILEKGGIDGEGSHKLIRDKKRPDQNVYLTSSVLNLDEYVGKRVRVWGETNASQKAGWLMDVGKIEVL